MTTEMIIKYVFDGLNLITTIALLCLILFSGKKTNPENIEFIKTNLPDILKIAKECLPNGNKNSIVKYATEMLKNRAITSNKKLKTSEIKKEIKKEI